MSYYSNPYFTNLTQNGVHSSNARYKKKYNRLKRRIRNLVIENAALCDQVAQMQENMSLVKEERRFLMRKLLEYEGDGEAYYASMRNSTSPSTSFSDYTVPMKKPRRKPPAESKANKTPKPRKSVAKQTVKQLVQPIPLDPTGRPIFPICLGGLTIHYLGEVISNKPNYHTENLIFPVGFVSTRVYGSFRDPQRKCIYTCKISDGGNTPRFEIAADTDMDSPIVGPSPNYCHSLLLRQIADVANLSTLSSAPSGACFFGLSHPNVLNLIQSSPGARKCATYKWTKFEASKTGDVHTNDERDPSVGFESLQRTILLSTYRTIPQIKEEPPDDILEPSADINIPYDIENNLKFR